MLLEHTRSYTWHIGSNVGKQEQGEKCGNPGQCFKLAAEMRDLVYNSLKRFMTRQGLTELTKLQKRSGEGDNRKLLEALGKGDLFA